MADHCSDLDGDRAYGARVESEFERRCASLGMLVHRFQVGREEASAYMVRYNARLIAPDVAVWDAGVAVCHEVKGKYPTRGGYFGLEEYRIRSLLTIAENVSVRYTIRAGANGKGEGRAALEQHGLVEGMWLSRDIKHLAECGWVRPTPSWVNGQRVKDVPCRFWNVRAFERVEWLTDARVAAWVTPGCREVIY